LVLSVEICVSTLTNGLTSAPIKALTWVGAFCHAGEPGVRACSSTKSAWTVASILLNMLAMATRLEKMLAPPEPADVLIQAAAWPCRVASCWVKVS
jgi:hypothetical protein